MLTLAALPEFRGRELPARMLEIEARRATLLRLPEAELLQHRAGLLAKQKVAQAAADAERQRNREAAAIEKERRQFYNQPAAQANFDYWLKFGFWSFDQAIALILGKNPNEVTPEKVEQALNPPRLLLSPKPAPTQFLKGYANLRTLAGASEVMTASPKLRPVDVANWARSRLGLTLPKPLADLLAPSGPEELPTPRNGTEEKLEQAQVTRESDADSKPVLVKRAALKALSDRWPGVETDLRHSDRNGLAAAAKAPEHGMWREQDALEWARRNGRLKPLPQGGSLQDLPRRIFRSDG